MTHKHMHTCIICYIYNTYLIHLFYTSTFRLIVLSYSALVSISFRLCLSLRLSLYLPPSLCLSTHLHLYLPLLIDHTSSFPSSSPGVSFFSLVFLIFSPCWFCLSSAFFWPGALSSSCPFPRGPLFALEKRLGSLLCSPSRDLLFSLELGLGLCSPIWNSGVNRLFPLPVQTK